MSTIDRSGRIERGLEGRPRRSSSPADCVLALGRRDFEAPVPRSLIVEIRRA